MMKVSKVDTYVIMVYFIVVLGIVAISWIMGMYGGGCRNLVSAEGVRHVLKYVLRDYASASPGALLLLTATAGVWNGAGLFSLFFTGHLSLRQRNALGVTLFIAVLSVVVIILGITLPHAVLLGVTGHIERSVLAEGCLPLIVFFFSIIGLVYGFALGTFNSLQTVVSAFTNGIVYFAPCFIALFLASQAQAWLDYAFYWKSPGLLSAVFLYFPFVLKCGIVVVGRWKR